jgi:hypothetical protein
MRIYWEIGMINMYNIYIYTYIYMCVYDDFALPRSNEFTGDFNLCGPHVPVRLEAPRPWVFRALG